MWVINSIMPSSINVDKEESHNVFWTWGCQGSSEFPSWNSDVKGSFWTSSQPWTWWNAPLIHKTTPFQILPPAITGGIDDSYLTSGGKRLVLSNAEWPFQLLRTLLALSRATKHHNSVTKGSDSVIRLPSADTSRLMSAITRPGVYYVPRVKSTCCTGSKTYLFFSP